MSIKLSFLFSLLVLASLMLSACAALASETPAVMEPQILDVGSTMVSEKDDMTLLYVPAGEFAMGSDNGADNEAPVHTVYLDAFWIDQTEVTNAMYAKCVRDGMCKLPTDPSSFSHSRYYGDFEFGNFPVIYVNWDMAKTYCEWRGARLLTEAEWEKAARGADGRTYPWGEDIGCDKTNYNNCVGDAIKVGNYPDGVSPYGVYDMAGNVWEWVNDWYGGTYYQSSPSSNPLGPDSGTYRALRGGSWLNNNDNTRSTLRNRNVPTVTNFIFGFRCARDVSP